MVRQQSDAGSESHVAFRDRAFMTAAADVCLAPHPVELT